MSAEMLIANLLRVAREDLDAARLLKAAGNRNAMYHCEQAAEKIIKAVLTSEGTHRGIKHQLDELVDAIPDENPIKPRLREIEYLSAYATAYRYPTDKGRIAVAPPEQQVESAIDKVASALLEVVTRFDVDLDRSGTAPKRPGPIR